MADTPIKTAAFGSWQSPIKAELLVEASVRLGEPRIFNEHYYWLEGRPQEKGRVVLVRAPIETPADKRDISPASFSVRSSCHEYGGASYCVCDAGIFFVNAADQRIYRLDFTGSEDVGAATPLTPDTDRRYVDLVYDQHRQRLLAIEEDHHAKNLGSAPEESNHLVAVSLEGDVQRLASGADFYSNPSISTDGKSLSWLSWNHPNMPWDASSCYLASINNDGSICKPHCIAGADHGDGSNEESVFQPTFGPDGFLYFVSDRNEWWNLYRYCPKTKTTEPLAPKNAEFATPQWVFGMSCYAFLDSQTIICCYTENGRWELAELDLGTKTLNTIESPYDDISMLAADRGRALFFAANSHSPSALFEYQSKGQLTLIHNSSSTHIKPEYVSTPQALSFASGNEIAHGFYYPPCNPEYQAPEGELPPLIVLCHGGPTGATDTALNVKIQYWTSRGFAIFDINYRGSTGYGRPYRDSLKGQWGVKDVEDVCAGAMLLVEKGLADPERLAIKGGSAGGYTVLAALTFSDVFSAGASHYGVGDLETLVRDTHKFESRYLDSVVGPYPDCKALYQQRSPIHSVEQLNCPVIFFQGLDDKIVPPNQAETMVAALTEKGLPVAYVPFAGEGHGFRGAEAIVQSLEGELYFYSQVFNFEVAGLQTIAIHNLSKH